MTTPIEASSDQTQDDSALAGDSLATGVVLLLGLTIVQRGVGFLRGVLFCRWLDADQLGQWDLAYGFLMLAAPLAVLGLPGSFGRYVEHYRRKGQLRPFLRRVTTVTLLLATAGVAVMVLARNTVARLVFNSESRSDTVLWMALALGLVIGFHFLVSLFTALRKYRVVTGLQFCNSLLFAVVSLALLAAWSTSTTTVVVAFAAACGVTAAVGLGLLIRTWGSLPESGAAMPHHSLWARLLPFAAWLWMTNWLSNLFEIADRFMIVHFSGLPSWEALGLVGQYHSARIIPVLFIGVAEMLAATVTPHLIGDWESGRGEKVSRRLNLIIKTFGLGVLGASIAAMVASPLLFGLAFEGKYAGGEAVLPLALACSIWTGLAALTYNYLWCAEKSRYVALVLSVGVGANLILNVLLLPPLGLLGAVLATGISRLAALALLWRITRRHGMHLDRGLVVVAALPLLLMLGPGVTLVVAGAVALGALPTARVFTAGEKAELAGALHDYRLRLKAAVTVRLQPSRISRRSAS